MSGVVRGMALVTATIVAVSQGHADGPVNVITTTTPAVPVAPVPVHPAATQTIQQGVNQFINGTPQESHAGLQQSAAANAQIAAANAKAAEHNQAVAKQRAEAANQYATAAAANTAQAQALARASVATLAQLDLPMVVVGGPGKIIRLAPTMRTMPAPAPPNVPDYGELLSQIQEWLLIFGEIRCNHALREQLLSRLETARGNVSKPMGFWGVADVSSSLECKIAFFEPDPYPPNSAAHSVLGPPWKKYRIFTLDVYPWIEIGGRRY